MAQHTDGTTETNGTGLTPPATPGDEVASRFARWFTQTFAPWYVQRLERFVGPLDGSNAGVRHTTLKTPEDVFAAAESVALDVPWRAGHAHRLWRDHLSFFGLAGRQVGRVAPYGRPDHRWHRPVACGPAAAAGGCWACQHSGALGRCRTRAGRFRIQAAVTARPGCGVGRPRGRSAQPDRARRVVAGHHSHRA